MGIFIDRLGKRFGRLTVIERCENKTVGKSVKVVWKCLCDCGKEKITTSSLLISGRVSSCGCYRRDLINSRSMVKDLSGEAFSYLKVIRDSGKRAKSNAVMWECECVCGRLVLRDTGSLRSGNTVSCGCKRFDYEKRSKISYDHLKRLPDGQVLSGALFLCYQNGAKSRNLSFDLSIEDAWDLFLKQKGICALTGLPLSLHPGNKGRLLSTASLDRINSELGYSIENVQWVHKRINTMKSNMTDEYFIQLCKLVSEEAERKVS